MLTQIGLRIGYPRVRSKSVVPLQEKSACSLQAVPMWIVPRMPGQPEMDQRFAKFEVKMYWDERGVFGSTLGKF